MSTVDKVKFAVKLISPRPLRRFARDYLSQMWDVKHKGYPTEEIFSAIYREHKWGTHSEDGFSSGTGSHNPATVVPYVSAVQRFLQSLTFVPSVVDLGCGDFNVGRQLRPYCGHYVACDVVGALIERNKRKFSDVQVDFRRIDIIEDGLPNGDIVFLRQVLQHLSNAQISQVVRKLYQYKFVIVTEHVPARRDYQPNRDKATGGGIRLRQGSGVVLTAQPFLLKVKSETVMCTTSESLDHRPGLVTTMLYEVKNL
jgi:SAM-dependent methyltransferase